MAHFNTIKDYQDTLVSIKASLINDMILNEGLKLSPSVIEETKVALNYILEEHIEHDLEDGFLGVNEMSNIKNSYVAFLNWINER